MTDEGWVLGVPPVPGAPPMLDSALQMMSHDLPVAQLLRQGQQSLKAGDAEGALEAFTAVLSLDPRNREAAGGARDAGRRIQERMPRASRRPLSPPPPSSR